MLFEARNDQQGLMHSLSLKWSHRYGQWSSDYCIAAAVFPADCPEAWKLYGSYNGGFCCDRTVTGDSTCDGGICAIASNSNTQGLPYCSVTRGRCPVGAKPYGFWAGGFCCTGTLNTQYGYPSGCTGSVCALDATRTQGYPVCSSGKGATLGLRGELRILQ